MVDRTIEARNLFTQARDLAARAEAILHETNTATRGSIAFAALSAVDALNLCVQLVELVSAPEQPVEPQPPTLRAIPGGAR